uniref:peptidylprolyl isomerase n=1 Tax=Pyrodinium bahamense TaxID=73915 RepID=A0A7S0FQW0_9DINO|mmetsp:Transcript_42376/g.117961  ORF Transcript_42376/g.117961 Transcript_42376/m.117961 type:complete len:392 (+) Transcript_42376:79-1254(+)|eukprot:CAMPEP_0179188416 /NCGR_PEP_ID=MMETSP0796-20121207/93513_1 /TAXON_ID=73915 /ORGANISM="Pyrodinium bahamense, Strain pbaha01" /LENGTH=391 /DNA_ID=CAMNT_0020892515 /DNA_START=71 /DNA_END=1246 /DNA_ORIENTATION=-
MASSWRVVLEAVEGLGNPSYRVGDFARALAHEDVKVRNAVLELSLPGRGEAPQLSRPFDVDDQGSAKINQVLFVQKPTNGQAVLLRVVKPHRVQKDALIGEVEVQQASGRQRLPLSRRGKPRGFLQVNITDGIPAPPPQLPVKMLVTAGANTAAAVKEAPPASRPGGNELAAAAAAAAAGHELKKLHSAARRPTLLDVAAMASHEMQRQVSGSSPGAGKVVIAAGAAADTKAKASDIASSLGSAASACFSGCWACAAGLLVPGAGEKRLLERRLSQPGVQQRPSGLKYRVLHSGQGRRHPTMDMPCECHYRGRLADGKEFDSSYRDGKPVCFMPQKVIPGWAEALTLMVEGDKWELFVPPQLAYGDRGVDGVIPGGATLIFEVELLKVQWK